MWSVYLVVFSVFFKILDSAGPPNPCPNYFQYEFNGTEWHGFISVPSLPNVKNVKINIRLSVATALPTKYSGGIKLLNSKESIFQTVKNGGNLNYEVLFPIQLPLPILTELSVNGFRICSGPPVSGAFVTSISLEHLLFLQPQGLSTNGPLPIKIGPKNTRLPLEDTQVNLFPSRSFRPAPTDEPAIGFIAKGPYDNVCGTATHTKPLIVSGVNSQRSGHPWLVAIFVHTEIGIVFMCAGSLVSKKHVLTAAHCIRLSEKQSPDEFIAMLGKYRIKKFNEPGSLIADVGRIDVHPAYRIDSSDADIAMLTLSEPVQFTSAIRPICVFTQELDLSPLVGKLGTIAGWGRDENGNRVSAELKETRVRVVSQETCLRSHSEFRQITSNRTFCAGGELEGSGPCTGDSGGGLLISIDGRMYLRGIISTALVEKGNDLGCDTFTYSVFTDVGKFSYWILSFILN